MALSRSASSHIFYFFYFKEVEEEVSYRDFDVG